ncbi:MAG: response regulator [Gammaproteobacteria bacterium]
MSQSLRILLIADDPDVIRRIGHSLRRQDAGLVMIEGADSLATARRRLSAAAYDLALVDLGLGHGDGLHMLSDLHEMAPDLPVVALSADRASADTAACMALGAQDRLAPEALDSAGLLDRLQSATARARALSKSRRRSQRIAASLGAAGDLAWHYEQGQGEVWLAAANPLDWQLPAPECHESLEALRARVHPDDREMLLRQLEGLLDSRQPWQLEGRFKVGGGAYRWCTLRGRSHLDGRGRLEHASGVLSDAQRQQKKLRETRQGQRFLRAVFDSEHRPHAILDSAGIITDCNQAWVALDEPGCHAGRAFRLGDKFLDEPDDPDAFGDLDRAALARGIRQVLGGVAEHFSCEYGDEQQRWRIDVGPLLNPGIAGAVICHEEITATRRAETGLQATLEALERDFSALAGPMFRVAQDFAVLSANAAADLCGRAPIVGRDVLRVLPRPDAEAVGDALAAIAAGADAAVRDTKAADGQAMRWLVATRRAPDGGPDGFLVHGVDVSDLVAAAAAPPPATADPGQEKLAAELRAALATTERERDRLRAELAEQHRAVAAARGEAQAALGQAEQLRDQAVQAQHEADEARARVTRALDEAEEARTRMARALDDAEDLRRMAAQAAERGSDLAEALESERARHKQALAALAAARQIPVELRAALDQARRDLRAGLVEQLDRAFAPLLDEPGRAKSTTAGDAPDKEKAS